MVGRLDVAPSQDHRDKSGSNPKKTHHVLEGVGWRSPVYVGDGCVTLVRERSSAPGSLLSLSPSLRSLSVLSPLHPLLTLSDLTLSVALALSSLPRRTREHSRLSLPLSLAIHLLGLPSRAALASPWFSAAPFQKQPPSSSLSSLARSFSLSLSSSPSHSH